MLERKLNKKGIEEMRRQMKKTLQAYLGNVKSNVFFFFKILTTC
jgi:hypothetical protein